MKRNGAARTVGGKTPTPLSEFMDANWDKLGLRNYEASELLGITAPNMISMWRTGQTAVPLHRLPKLAEVMGVDVMRLYPLWLQQQRIRDDDLSAEFVEMLQRRTISENESELIHAVRSATRNADPQFNSIDLARVTKAVLGG